MAKAKNEIKQQAFELYKQGLKLVEIAERLAVPDGTVRRWKCTDKWEEQKPNVRKKSERSRGGQPGNKNAVGNKGGAPKGNKNAEKHGLFSKYLPEETLDIIESMKDKTPLDLIWDAIEVQYAAIIRSQKIMHVEDKDDRTSTQIGFSEGKTSSETWEIQQAWDKQASFLKAQSKAVDSLKNMVKDYLELEGASKTDTKEQVQDWKSAIIAIAKRRGEKSDGRTD